MSQCPNCSVEVEEGFGLTQCPGCASMLVFGFDGELKVSPEGSEALQDHEVNEFTEAQDQVEVPFEDISYEVEPETTEEVQQEVKMETFEPSLSANSDTLEGVQEFANSEDSDAPDGEYLYKLKISEVDDVETRQTLWEILSEQRLRLDVDALKHQFKDGVLEIPKLNPVKAHYIVTQLRQLPVEVVWTQISIYQGEMG